MNNCFFAGFDGLNCSFSASKFRVSSIFYRHPERSEGSTDRDFSPAAQNDEFLDTTFRAEFGGINCTLFLFDGVI